ncbi:hypothetical protein LF1_47620 [Rubripirellula obstinata]|uniref:Calcineurin-like phosphoesterase domain-containing protein n=1 Tax=Rubripirellula obstinata TaxID=406547 RepID=A0A5B1CRD7_9BACT|nr:ligase-associated DNA damage response endonuclease PdeM [Rubripirellula obstinata]KAA1262200.1 hypothetical protein LF1_47620 [Rubripirellula obstinata]
MTKSVSVTIGDVELELFAKRAAFSKTHAALFIADPHFGKEATFRRGGIPVPQGSTDGTLDTIAQLLSETKANKLIILGDMFHARSSLSDDVRESLGRFFETHHDVEHILIRGNHDAHVGQLPASWPIKIREPGERLGSIVLNHHPSKVPVDAAALFCGHLHPAIRFSVGGESTGKLPCFWLSSGCLVFPAIGEFTGTHVIQPTSNDQVWAIADDQIFGCSPVSA